MQQAKEDQEIWLFVIHITHNSQEQRVSSISGYGLERPAGRFMKQDEAVP